LLQEHGLVVVLLGRRQGVQIKPPVRLPYTLQELFLSGRETDANRRRWRIWFGQRLQELQR